MFDWTVLNLQNERGRTGAGGSERPVSVPRGEEPVTAPVTAGRSAGIDPGLAPGGDAGLLRTR